METENLNNKKNEQDNTCYYTIDGNHVWQSDSNIFFSCVAILQEKMSTNIQVEVVSLKETKPAYEEICNKTKLGLVHKLQEECIIYKCGKGNHCDNCSKNDFYMSRKINIPDFDSENFKHKYNLKKNKLSHNGITSYQCVICGALFSSLHRMKQHQGLHYCEKIYICGLCDKGFRRSEQLKDHMYNHSGDRPFRCDQCDDAFIRKSSLNRHNKLLHDKKRLTCNKCGKRFLSKQTLNLHRKSC